MKYVQIAIMAAVETGNMDRARSLLLEYADLDPEGGDMIRKDVLEAYNLEL